MAGLDVSERLEDHGNATADSLKTARRAKGRAGEKREKAASALVTGCAQLRG